MVSIIKSAKSIQEAIRLGCEELKCTRSDVEIEVIDMGSNGIFGLFGKPAKVKITKKDNEEDFSFDMPKISLDAKSTPKQKPKASAQKEESEKPVQKAEKPEKQTQKPKQQKNKQPKPAKEKAPKEEQVPQEEKQAEIAEPEDEIEEFVVTPADKLSSDAVTAINFLKELCAKMGVEVQLEAMESENQLRLKMAGDNMSLLIGRRGETLDSIQYLTSLCVNRTREDYMRISIDAENYRAKREEALKKLAVRMAAKAKKTGKRVSLEPMNPYERRILHSALQNDPDVTTHSEGDEPYRKVIITLK